MLRDLLFRLRLYPGTLIRCPPGLVTCKALHPHNIFVRTYITELNLEHHAAMWLLEECEGPWAIRMLRPIHYRRVAIAFAQAADALNFRIIFADNYS